MKTLSEIIGEGIGEASMCWSETPKGIFESERASNIVDKILLAVDAELQKEREINKVLTEALKFYANRDNYDREGTLSHTEWSGEPHLSEMKDYWVDYGFTSQEALSQAEEMRK